MGLPLSVRLKIITIFGFEIFNLNKYKLVLFFYCVPNFYNVN
jgi:hypothetical protein